MPYNAIKHQSNPYQKLILQKKLLDSITLYDVLIKAAFQIISEFSNNQERSTRTNRNVTRREASMLTEPSSL